MISEEQQSHVMRYGIAHAKLMEDNYTKRNDLDTYSDMLLFGAIPKEQLVDGRIYIGFMSIPGVDRQAVEALWVSAMDAFVYREAPGADGCIDALHYFHPYPDSEYFFIPFFNEPQGEPNEQLCRPPAEHTA